MVAVVYLQNFSPKGIIKNDFINKVNIYDKIYDKIELINNIYRDFSKKIELLNDYVYILNDKKIIITQQSIKDLITKLVNDNYYLTNIQ